MDKPKPRLKSARFEMRASEAFLETLNKLAEHEQMSKPQVIEMLVREEAKKKKLI